MPSSGLWKTILLPPLLALTIYVFSTYVLLPLLARYRIRSAYTALPTSLTSSLPSSTSLLSRFWPRRRSSGGSLLGDEELEEGMVVGGGGGDGGRRLSRELEGGFMDDSDDEVEDER